MYFFAGLGWVHTAHTLPLQKNLVWQFTFSQECYFHFVLILSKVSLTCFSCFQCFQHFCLCSIFFSIPIIQSMGSFSPSWLLNQAMRTKPVQATYICAKSENLLRSVRLDPYTGTNTQIFVCYFCTGCFLNWYPPF